MFYAQSTSAVISLDKEYNRFTLNQTKGQFKMWERDEDVEERQWNITVTVNQYTQPEERTVQDVGKG